MKRFYKAVDLSQVEGGWSVTLDGKPIRTPGKAPLVAESRGLMEAVAAEWDAQEAEVRPLTMPFTRSINTAIDRVTPEFDQVVEMVAAYGGSDLICYRADAPEALRARQAEAWDPMLDWAREAHQARLLVTTGVMHTLQPEEGQRNLAAAVRAHDPFALTALYDLVALSGSLVIGLAVADRRLSPDEGWRISRIDEDWQAEQWGVDAEAAATAAWKAGEFAHAARFIEHVKAGEAAG